MLKKLSPYLLYIVFAQALLAMLGSLFFSEVLKFPPCVLCWYQRICLYPIVVISLIGILKQDKQIASYILPLSIIGLSISIYHNLLYYNIIPEAIAPCVAGISCTTKFIEYFGFITIPFLSMIAFAIITICMLFFQRFTRYDARS